jgi:signal transduction histidine kinase
VIRHQEIRHEEKIERPAAHELGVSRGPADEGRMPRHAQAARLAIDEAELRLREQQRQAWRFLADATAMLSESLDYELTLRRLASAVVPRLGDGCVVHLIEDGALSTVAVAHADPAKAAMLREMNAKFGAQLGDDRGVAHVVRTGLAELHPVVTDEMLVASARSEEHLAKLRAMGFRSAILAPLKAHGTTLGTIVVVTAESGRRFDEDDLSLLEELGRRAAFAIENARAFEEARTAARLRDEFLSIAGHELRTPLAALQLQLQSLLGTLAGGTDPANVERLATRLRKAIGQGRRLEQLVNELLEASRISCGCLPLEPEVFDLAALVDEVVERYADAASRAGSSISTEKAGETVGCWDRGRLDQVIANLLGNAIKYGCGQPIDVSVRGDGSNMRLAVRDRGIGIEPRHHARIFGRFERAVSERNYGGFGLGLWIVRRVVEAHGGKVSFESRSGEGSTFVVDLPVRKNEEP